MQIRAEAVIPSVFAWSTFHVAEEGRADVADQSLRRVDQRQALLDLLVSQSIPDHIIDDIRGKERERRRKTRDKRILISISIEPVVKALDYKTQS